MGGLFCSYLVENQISLLRKAIAESRLNEMCQELRLKANNNNSKKASSTGSFLFSASNFTSTKTNTTPPPSSQIDTVTNTININMNLNTDDEDYIKQTKLNELIDSEIDSVGNTPLIYSIEMKQLNSFKFLLLELNANPNKPNYYTGYTPLHVLCLTKSSNDPNAQSARSSTKSTSTNINNNRISVSHMNGNMSNSITLHNHPELNNQDSFPNSERTLTSKNHSKLVQTNSTTTQLTTSNYLDVNDLGEMLDLLIAKKADLNVLAKVSKNTLGIFDFKYATPLIFAVYNQNKICIERLVKGGCDCNYQDSYSKINAMHMLCYMCRIDMISLLLDNCNNINLELKSREGSNCLHWLAISDRDDIGILRLIMNYVTKDFEKKNFNTSQNNAIDYSEMNFIYLSKLDDHLKNFVDQTNENQQTALMLAAKMNKQNLVKALLDYDASIELKDINGLTAINYASSNSCSELIKSYNKVKKITLKKSSLYFRTHSTANNNHFVNNKSQSDINSTKYSTNNFDINEQDEEMIDEPASQHFKLNKMYQLAVDKQQLVNV